MDTYNLCFEQGLSSYALDFLESSSLTPYNAIDTSRRIMALMGSPYYSSQVVNSTMELGVTEKVPLAAEFNNETRQLREIQCKRHSTRQFNAFISIRELSSCLLSSYFITERFETHSHHLARRSIASGGALYPIDLYYISLHTKGLNQGVYAYNPHKEHLEVIRKFGSRPTLSSEVEKALPDDMRGNWDMKTVSGIIVFGAALNRVACKYGDRGLRFALMDVGAICQNLHLAAATTGISCCAIGGYLDHQTNRLMGFTEPDETTLLTMFVGKNVKRRKRTQ